MPSLVLPHQYMYNIYNALPHQYMYNIYNALPHQYMYNICNVLPHQYMYNIYNVLPHQYMYNIYNALPHKYMYKVQELATTCHQCSVLNVKPYLNNTSIIACLFPGTKDIAELFKLQQIEEKLSKLPLHTYLRKAADHADCGFLLIEKKM